MEKPIRINFSEIPEHLICQCGENTIFEDQSILGLGMVCVICSKYCDDAHAKWLAEKKASKVNYVQTR